MENALVARGRPAARRRARHGAPDVVGSVTSGGTESLILAVKAARDARPEIAAPRLVVPVDRARRVRQGRALPAGRARRGAGRPGDLRGRPGRDGRGDHRRTPCWSPARRRPTRTAWSTRSREIAAVAAERGVRCHVDACFGGWVAALPAPARRRPCPPFDFAVPGVTSISVDLHKYAYAPKGVSVLLHRDAALRAPQYFAYADWPGYTMVNPVISSTRSGGPIAAAFATLRHLGDDGLPAAGRGRPGTRSPGWPPRSSDVDGLRLLAPAESTVVCLTSDDPALDLFVLADELAARGWHTQPQLPYAGSAGQHPPDRDRVGGAAGGRVRPGPGRGGGRGPRRRPGRAARRAARDGRAR